MRELSEGCREVQVNPGLEGTVEEGLFGFFVVNMAANTAKVNFSVCNPVSVLARLYTRAMSSQSYRFAIFCVND